MTAAPVRRPAAHFLRFARRGWYGSRRMTRSGTGARLRRSPWPRAAAARLPRVGGPARRRRAREPRRAIQPRRAGAAGHAPSAPRRPARAGRPRRRRCRRAPISPPEARAARGPGHRRGGRPGALDRRRGGGGGRLHARRSVRRLDALHLRASRRRPDGQPLPNRYRRIFLGLANDQLDEDGEPLAPGSKNYLELYGIFPSMSVLRARFVEDEQHPCHDQESADALDAVETVTYVAPADLKQDERRLATIREELETARKKAHLADARRARRAAARVRAQGEAARAARGREAGHGGGREAPHLRGAAGGKGKAHHQPGIYDDAMRLAVRRFQQKHMIYEANYLRRKTVDALARPLLDNDYDALVRALRERVVDAAGDRRGRLGVEDAQPRRRVREGRAASSCSSADAQAALAFFKRHPARRVQAAARRRSSCRRAPTTTPTTWTSRSSSIAATSGTTCRSTTTGTTSRSRARSTRRSRCTRRSGGKLIALARWRTTIGGWRAEQASERLRVLPLQGVGRRAARDPPRGLGAGLDRAHVDADPDR